MDKPYLDLDTFYYVGKKVQIFDYTVFVKPENIAIDDNVRIDSFTKIEGGEWVHIGANSHIAAHCVLNTGGGTLIIHPNVGIAAGTIIATGQPDLKYHHITPNSPFKHEPIRQATYIHRGVFIGVHCTILMGVTIGAGAIIKAHALITKDVPPNAIVQGVNQIVGERDYHIDWEIKYGDPL